jgi:hypothetical protein
LRSDPHAHERRAIGDGRDDEIAIAFEGDESLVEEVIDRGGEQKSILAVEARVPSPACGRGLG